MKRTTGKARAILTIPRSATQTARNSLGSTRLLTVGCAEVSLSIELGGKAVEKRTIAGKERLICWAMLPMLSKNMKAGARVNDDGVFANNKK
jgi:hypothetical protein